MKYIGSKNKIAKELAPIIQSYIDVNTVGYLEPFVGGANMIDKISHPNLIGCDIHPQLIAVLTKARDDVNNIPDEISEDLYLEVKNNKENYEDWFVGLVGFCATFGAKYFGGYARSPKDNRNMPAEGIRNLKRQAPKLKGIEFKCSHFLDIPTDNLKGYVIYCDIPYRNTTSYKTEKFPYEAFYKWAKEMSVHNTVLISEYTMPEGFECIWEKRIHTPLSRDFRVDTKSKHRTEKLFKCK